jgi:hypothetical protein
VEQLSEIAGLLRREFDDEVAAGFTKLRRIPSTGIIKFLDCFDSFPSGQHAPLLDAIARIAATRFLPAAQIAAEHEKIRTSDFAFTQFQAAMQSPAFGYLLRYVDVKMARMMLSDQQTLDEMAKMWAGLNFVPRDDPPAELVADPDLRRLHPAKAPLLRKLVKAAVGGLLSAKGTKLPGGEVKYTGTVGGVPMTVATDFGSRLGQLRYGVSWVAPEQNIRVAGLAFESLWGAHLGWDYLTEENAASSIELLCDQLRYLARLFDHIANFAPDQKRK